MRINRIFSDSLQKSSGNKKIALTPTSNPENNLQNIEDKVSCRTEARVDKTPGFSDVMTHFLKNEKETSNAPTVENMKALLDRKKSGVKSKVIINNDKHIHTEFSGVPDFVEPYDHRGVTFRHFFRSKEQKSSALSSGKLIAGPVSYAQVYGGVRNDYLDLTGVFITKPGVKPEDVGVPGHDVYIDIRFPDDTGVVEIEPGLIYMVPGKPKIPDWIADYYNKYKTGEKIPDYVLSSVKKIEANGGITPPTSVFFTAEKKQDGRVQ